MSKIKRHIKIRNKRNKARSSTIIYTLFGAYIIYRGGRIGVASLIKLIKPLGLSENAIRLALSRMSKQEMIRTRKIGRKSYCSLTKKGNEWMFAGQHWALERDYNPWDKKWRLLTYNIPEKSRRLRDALREKLRAIGYGSLGGSLWITPYNLKTQFVWLFDKIKVADYVETFETKYTGLHDSRKLATKAWDIQGLAKQYKEFVKKYSPLYAAHKEKIKKNKVIDPEECFATSFRLTAEYIDIVLTDPILPLELLPANWAGLKAKKIYLEYRNLLIQKANQFVDSMFKPRKIIKKSGKNKN